MFSCDIALQSENMKALLQVSRGSLFVAQASAPAPACHKQEAKKLQRCRFAMIWRAALCIAHN